MKQTESFEFKGYWWLPSNPDNKVAGVITYTSGKSLVLELFGSFEERGNTIECFMSKSLEATIHGTLENAKKITLLQCDPSGSYNFSSSFPVIRYSCVYCFIGGHYTNLDEKGRFTIAIHFPEMPHWCHPGIIQETFKNNKEDDGHTISLSVNSEQGGKVIDEVRLDDGFKIQLKAGAIFSTNAGLLDNHMGQTTWIEISKEGSVSFKDLIQHGYKFESFLSLATLRVVEASEIYIYNEDYYQESEEGKKHYIPIYFFSRFWRGRDTEKVEYFKFLFGYDAIKDRFAELMRTWYADRNDMSPIRSNLIDSLEKKRVFSNLDFLILARALDGFCIRSKIKGQLGNQMKKAKEKFSDVTYIKKDDINVEELVDSRDYYAHYVLRSSKKHILDGFELHTLTQKVRRLVICCVLSDLGMDNHTIDNILKKSNSRYIC